MEEWISVIKDGVNAFFTAVHEVDYSSLRQCHRLLESYVIYSGWGRCLLQILTLNSQTGQGSRKVDRRTHMEAN